MCVSIRLPPSLSVAQSWLVAYAQKKHPQHEQGDIMRSVGACGCFGVIGSVVVVHCRPLIIAASCSKVLV